MTSASTRPATAPALDAAAGQYLEALLAADSRRAWAVVEIAQADDASAARVYLDVLAPAMERVGELWAAAQIGVAQEHLATQITQAVLARLAPALERRGPREGASTVLVAGTPGELHAIGGRMVADFLEGDGWAVLYVGPDTPADDLVALAAAQRPAVVALSTSLANNLPAAEAVFRGLRTLQPTPLLVAGGRAFAGDATRATAIGADVYAADPETLLAELAGRFG